MNHETIWNFLNTPIEELVRDEAAIENAKDQFKKYESFNTLLNGKGKEFNECKDICLLELCNNLGMYKDIDRNFLLGFKAGLNSLEECYRKYVDAREYLSKEGV